MFFVKCQALDYFEVFSKHINFIILQFVISNGEPVKREEEEDGEKKKKSEALHHEHSDEKSSVGKMLTK